MSKSIHLTDLDFKVVSFGSSAKLLRPTHPLANPLALPRLGQALADHLPPGISDVIASTSELCLVFEGDPSHGLDSLPESVAQLHPTEPHSAELHFTEPRRFHLPVLFDGNDWQTVSAYTGLTQAAYLQRLKECPVTVAMYGFLPGFAYLTGLPADLRCPRKDTPSHTVAAGSVAVGGPHIGIYGSASPAGWQVLGRTPVQVAQLEATPPTNLRIGDQIHFRVIEEEEFETLANAGLALASCIEGPDR